MMRKLRFPLLATLLGSMAVLFIIFSVRFKPAGAESVAFTVNSTTDATDANPGDGVCETAKGVCTLRAAVQESNALAGDDTIILPSGIYTLTIAGSYEDESAFGDLDILDNVTILGSDINNTIIDGNGTDRIFHVFTNTVASMSDLTIQNGHAVQGSGIWSAGELILLKSHIVNFTRGKSIIYNHNLFLIDNSTFSHNTLSSAFGVLQLSSAASGTVNNSHFHHNTLTGNFSDYIAGNIVNRGTITINNTEFHDTESAPGYEGHRAVGIWNLSGQLTINNSSIHNNEFGIYSEWGDAVTINHTQIYDNLISGISVDDGSLTVNHSIISGNGTGIVNGYGIGGVTATINNSIINNNGPGLYNNGGGIFNRKSALTFLNNSTVSGNMANWSGGGIYNYQSATLNLNNSTIANNTADNDADGEGNGGGIYNDLGEVNLHNSIIAGNIDANPTTQYPDCFTESVWNSEGYNLIQNGTGCILGGDTTGNQIGVDPLLGPLQDNGGATMTHALLEGSPAIDAGDPAGCNSGTDQRGFSRYQDGDGNGVNICDIGAYEWGETMPIYIYLPSVMR